MAGGGWSSLPMDLLKEVSARLSSDADHLHIHQVSPHWRASTSLPVPWVVAGRARRFGPVTILENSLRARRFGLVTIGEYSIRLTRGGAQSMGVGSPPSGLRCCCGASRGWLALVDDDRSPTRLMLWEPVSNTEISLPCLGQVTRIFLSDDPLTSSDWIAVAAQVQYFYRQRTLIWRPGDAAWTVMHEQTQIATLAFHEGKAYYMDIDHNIVMCDLNTETDSSPMCTPISSAAFVVSNLCRCPRSSHLFRAVHLVACNGELLLVVLYWGSHPAGVYKLVLTPNQRLELLEKVTNLGDHSLFVSKGGDTFALSAKEFPAVKRNCIYYADAPCDQQYWISLFHLESDFVEEIPYPEELKEDTTNWTPYAWFCPRKPFLKQA